MALARGARGSIMIPLPGEGRVLDWDYWVNQFRFEDVRPPIEVSDHLNVLLRLEPAAELFRGSGHTLAEVLEHERLASLRSFPLETRITFQVQSRERTFVDCNVAGVLAGSDPILKDSNLTVIAHYDHLGTGAPVRGDSIYNGAVDNALGVSVALELARVLADAGIRRSLLFLLVTGEEKGLLGSRYYCEWYYARAPGSRMRRRPAGCRRRAT